MLADIIGIHFRPESTREKSKYYTLYRIYCMPYMGISYTHELVDNDLFGIILYSSVEWRIEWSHSVITCNLCDDMGYE